MSTTRSEKILRVSAVTTIVALGLVSWGILDPRPLPVLVGLSIGQGLGTLSFLGFLAVVAADLGVKRHIKHEGVEGEPRGNSEKPPPAA